MIINIDWIAKDFYIHEALTTLTPTRLTQEKILEKVNAYTSILTKKLAEYFFDVLLIEIAGELGYSVVKANALPNTIPGVLDRRYEGRKDVYLYCKNFAPVSILNNGLYVFKYGNWSPYYGGMTWYRITEIVYNYYRKKYDDKTFVDTVFNLRHNGNCLFKLMPFTFAYSIGDNDETRKKLIAFLNKRRRMKDILKSIATYKCIETDLINQAKNQWNKRIKLKVEPLFEAERHQKRILSYEPIEWGDSSFKIELKEAL